ncbi:MAG: ribonuclease J [Chitinophagaceae bacterium]|nr:ribonuclease J [Anaerolineae bacterium]
MARPKLRIVPLGGLGEIGKNMTVFELGNDAIIIDTGIMFPANDMHGVDYIIPDFNYLINRTDLKIHAILYTHGHEDHIGAASHVVEALPNIPIYATPLTAGLLELKLKEGRVSNLTQINVFGAGDKFDLGPFKIESFHMCHSIPDCVGFAIHTSYGVIVHSGDYKFDNTPIDGKKPDYARLAHFAKSGVLLLMADSTNADLPGWTPSEAVIDGAFDKVFREANGRIMVATFASLISRVQQVANAAKRHGRKIAIAGHSMAENIKMARRLGILDLPDDLLIDVNRVSSIQPHKLVIMVTGSQGEPTSVLSRMAAGKYRALEVEKGDTIVLSSHPIPGNEEMVYRTINRLFQKGANVVYDPIAQVHVSGHARQEEMRLLINLVRPKYFLPIHGELRHLHEHSKIAMQSGIPKENIFVVENGQVIEIDKYGLHLGERVPGEYVFVDGSSVGDVGRVVMRDREVLSKDGFLLVAININAKTSELIGEPEVISRGFIYLRDSDDLLIQVKDVIQETLTSSNGSNGRLREKVQENVARILYNETKRRPMVFSVINER